MDVLSYYPLIGYDGAMNKFALVKATGTISRHADDSKIASASLTVEAELNLPEFISAAIKWMVDARTDNTSLASGHYSQLAAAGHYSQLAVSGYSSRLAASGDSSKLATSGQYSKLAASGHYSKLAASGHYSKLAASGDSSQLAAPGENSIVCAAATDCTASAGKNGCIVLTRWVESENRYRVSVAYVGENGIEPDVLYKLDEQGELVAVA